MQKRNRKGFTLAELLIVVAIIAILVAIAVPLFVGALGDAEERVEEANIRAVKSAAVASILLNDDKINDTNTKGWTATACVTTSGDVEHLAITRSTNAVTKTETCTPHEGTTGCGCGHESDASNKCACKYRVTVTITPLDLVSITEATAAAGVPGAVSGAVPGGV